jgi:hypothetical protein
MMFAEHWSQVESIEYEDDTIQILHTASPQKQAILYKSLMGKVEIGDEVLLNSTATSLKLGTGGYDFVKSVAKIEPANVLYTGDAGHILKLRYTPMQHQVLSIEAQESPFHSLFLQPFSLNGKPILLGELHSMIPLVYASSQVIKKDALVCVIIDDQAALPLAFSEHMRALMMEKNFTTITVGQAFGGTYEAITIQTALQFAYTHLKADVIMISVGPGVVGTGTYYGFTGMSLANWSNNVAALKGLPLWIPRVSFAEKRERHKGISHHTLTPLKQATLSRVLLALPRFDREDHEVVVRQLESLKQALNEPEIRWLDQKEVVELTKEALNQSSRVIKTMGRSYQEDPAFFWSVVASLLTSFNIAGE